MLKCTRAILCKKSIQSILCGFVSHVYLDSYCKWVQYLCTKRVTVTIFEYNFGCFHVRAEQPILHKFKFLKKGCMKKM